MKKIKAERSRHWNLLVNGVHEDEVGRRAGERGDAADVGRVRDRQRQTLTEVAVVVVLPVRRRRFGGCRVGRAVNTCGGRSGVYLVGRGIGPCLL